MLVHDYDAVARITAEFLFQTVKELILIILQFYMCQTGTASSFFVVIRLF